MQSFPQDPNIRSLPTAVGEQKVVPAARMVFAAQTASATGPCFSRLGFAPSRGSSNHVCSTSLRLSSALIRSGSCRKLRSLSSSASAFGAEPKGGPQQQGNGKMAFRAEASPVLKDKAGASVAEKKAIIEEAEKPDFKETFISKKADPHWDSKDKSEADHEISIGPDGLCR